jgi:hypothetical protein
MHNPPDIWERVARLDATCHVAVHSLYLDDLRGEPARHWEVVIRRRGAPESEPAVTIRRRALVEAIEAALLEAEVRDLGG